MTYHRTITAFVAIALLAAATTAAAVRPGASTAAEPEFVGLAAIGQKPMLEAKKPVRYEAIILNWKRYRSTAKSSG
jgi:hypothetical protein